MENYEVTGYKMVKNQDTWEMERLGGLITVKVECSDDDPEHMEQVTSLKIGADWFEAVTICKI